LGLTVVHVFAQIREAYGCGRSARGSWRKCRLFPAGALGASCCAAGGSSHIGRWGESLKSRSL